LIVYFDTSALVPIVIEEDSSERASRLWDEADRVVSSRLLYAEARAALARAGRSARIDPSGLRRAVGILDDLVEEIDMVEVTDSLVHRAGALAEQLSLRGYDAIHLASAEMVHDTDLVVATGDGALRAAAATLGLGIAHLV
jgi:predicted nucleic acid-binding protein